MNCEQCKKPAPKALPYGPGKSLICYPCAHDKDPELTAIAAMYEKQTIREEIEAKLAVLRAAFPDARIIRLDPDSPHGLRLSGLLAYPQPWH